MEPETHRRDREAMLAEHLAVAEQVHREIDEAVAAAGEKRDAYFEWFVDHVRVEERLQRDRKRLRADQRGAAGAREPASKVPLSWEEVDAERAPLAWEIEA